MKIRLAALLAVSILLSGCSSMMSPPVEAINDSDMKGLRQALDSGDPNAKIVRGDKKIPVLIKAYAVRQPGIARELLEQGADPFSQMEPGGGTVLHLFAETGNVGEARDVIARARLAARQRAGSPEEADKIFFEWLDRPFQAGYTAMHIAAMNGKTDVISLLIENGADPSLKDKRNRTAQYHLDQKTRASTWNFFVRLL
ncbi:MAG TPA: ankyrin repeat domain-containing protein [Burkholderiales bacterium]|nr:ankyrin repeat domain-containing protein [Burkholderiales bacterium]